MTERERLETLTPAEVAIKLHEARKGLDERMDRLFRALDDCLDAKDAAIFDGKLKRLEDVFDDKVNSLTEATKLAKQAIDTAELVRKAEFDMAVDRTREDMAVLRTADTAFLAKTDYDAAHLRLLELVKSLELSRAELFGKASQSQVFGAYALGIVGIIISIIHFFK